ncbi:hypothetical protein [Henriciella pelagia]|uniref:hypothetical protein n=1 Tax=Henriciella pelagia TaxID=1977912 RepID=UPI003510EF71
MKPDTQTIEVKAFTMGRTGPAGVTIDLPPKVILRQVAERHAVTIEAVLSRSRRRCYTPARREAVRRLRDEKRWSWGQLARLFSRSRAAVRKLYAEGVNQKSTHFSADELEAQIRRLAGAEIVHDVIDVTGVPYFQAQFLSVLIEAYPRVLSVDALCELYDAAGERLGMRDRKPSDDDMVRQFLYRSRLHFERIGLTEPAERIGRTGIRLTHTTARWFCYNMGHPVMSEERLAG